MSADARIAGSRSGSSDAGPAIWVQALVAVVALAVVTVLGAVRLADPFDGDQSLFLQYAEAIGRGAVLYTDIWDNKQPGIFAFYLVAGSIAGFTEVGIRLFELVYHLTFAVVLVVTLRSWLHTWWLATLAPIACIGAYYATTGTWHLTQTEFLVAFPLYLALWLAAAPWRTVQGRRLALLFAGVFAGVVIAFKLVFAPIVLVGWLLSLWTSEDPVDPRSAILDRALPAALGVAIVAGTVAGWFGANGATAEFLWVTFTYPLLAASEIAGAPLSRLLRSAGWYALAAAPWLLLAAAAGVRWKGRRVDWMTVQLVAWVVMGAAVILAQRFSWWEYHFTLFIVPVGLLAVRGADGLIAIARPSRQRVVAILAAGLLFVTPVAVSGVRTWRGDLEPLRVLGSLGDPAALFAYQRAMSGTYEQIWQDTRFLVGPEAIPGPIYVFGDPLYLQLSDRGQALPTHGWSWEMLLASQWAGLPGDLAAAAPAYVFLDDGYRGLVEDRAPAVMSWLETRYESIGGVGDGAWYRRTDR
jgi:hypothetical protein